MPALDPYYLELGFSHSLWNLEFRVSPCGFLPWHLDLVTWNFGFCSSLWDLSLSTWDLVLCSFWFLLPGTCDLVLGTCPLILGTWYFSSGGIRSSSAAA